MDTERRTVYDKDNFGEKTTYYKLEKELTWTLYIRFATRHFVPCKKCQVDINAVVEDFVASMRYQTGYQIADFVVTNTLCETCSKQLLKKVMHSDRIILGNKEYEPLIELQREWNEVEGSRTTITFEEYNSGTNIRR